MKSQDTLRIQQVEAAMKPFRAVVDQLPPPGGWIRTIREALGMTHAQLGKRVDKTPQTIDGMQSGEVAETIQLGTLRQLAEAMGCRLVYAVVPVKPVEELRRERAIELARAMLTRTAHSMDLEAQGVGEVAEQAAIERRAAWLLRGNPRRLWDQI